MKPNWSQLLQEINRLLAPVKEILVVIRSNPSLDSLVAGVALSEALKKIGRRATVVCPTKITGELGKLNISKLILDFIPQKQLEITKSYKTESSVGISFQREHQVKPETVFLIEVETLAHLQNLYQENQEFFKQVPLINLDYHSTNANYAKINLIDTKATSVSEIVTLMLYDLRVPFSPEMAKMLYQGIAFKTENFSPEYFSANALEAASICLRYQKGIQKPTGQATPLPRTQA